MGTSNVTHEDTRLGALLLESGLVAERDLRHGLEVQGLTGGRWPLGQILVDQGLVEAGVLEQLLGIQRRLRDRPPRTVDFGEGFGGDGMLEFAVGLGATDLLLSEGTRPRARIAGDLVDLAEEPLAGPELWGFVRRHMGMDALERIAERDSVTIALAPDAGVRGRVTAFRHFDGLAIAVRLHPAAVRTPEESGLDPRLVETVRSGRGLVLLCGTAGSGVTETFATLLAVAAAAEGRSVLALDDVFEYPAPDGGAVVTRRRVGHHTHDWASGVRAALREEPDALFVGDVDAASFDLVLHAAETGALVVACARAASTTEAIERTVDFRPAHDRIRVRNVLAAALQAVLAVRTVPDAEHRGSVLATELLLLDDATRDLVRTGALERLRALMRVLGSGHDLDASLVALVESGRARLEDVFPFARDKALVLGARIERAGAAT